MKPAFEAFDVLDGYFRLGRRSATLNGSIRLRAAQHCVPFVEGNAAGVQIWAPPSLLKHERQGADFYDASEHGLTEDKYERALAALEKSGSLSSYWLDRLGEGPTFEEDGILYLWTGLVIRPHEGVWLVVSGAYNRRVPAPVGELVYSDSEQLVPLLIPLKVDALTDGESIDLEGELACIQAHRPAADVRVAPVAEHVDALTAFADFYDAEYFEHKRTRATGRYKQRTRVDVGEVAHAAGCVAIELGAHIVEVCSYHHFVAVDGIAAQPATPGTLQYAIVRAQTDVEISWTGRRWTEVHEPLSGVDALRQTWQRLLGDRGIDHVERFANYVVFSLDVESECSLLPWLLLETAPGWSCILDGLHQSELEGHRGVVRSDQFHQCPVQFRALGPGQFHILKGEPVLRAQPILRELLVPEFRLRSLLEAEVPPRAQDVSDH